MSETQKDQLREELWEALEIIFTCYGDDLSFKEIAKLSGLSVPTVRRLWGGSWLYPRFQTIQKLASGIGLSVGITRGGVTLSLSEELGVE